MIYCPRIRTLVTAKVVWSLEHGICGGLSGFWVLVQMKIQALFVGLGSRRRECSSGLVASIAFGNAV